MGRFDVFLMMDHQTSAIRALFENAQAVIFDLDDTLLSYELGERGVFERIFAENGIVCTDEAIAHVWKVSWEEWDRLNLSETDRPEVAEHFHDLYRHYLSVFFDVLSKKFPFSDSNETLCRKFIDYLAMQNDYCTGAECLLKVLDGRKVLAVATSGLSDIQNPRIDRLPAAIGYRFISEEVGLVKPARAFFTHMSEKMAVAPEKCLMIGDSMRSDIGGALAVGMQAIWVHKADRVAPCVRVETLEEIVEILTEYTMTIIVRPYTSVDLPEMIAIWNEVVEEGVAFPQEETLTAESGEAFFASQTHNAVAVDECGRVCGLYILHPNNVGRCGHICNASYAVRSDCRGLHIGEKLVLDCLAQGKRYGFSILQFNAVVASNTHARHLYERLGFVQLGTIPKGFRMKDGHFEDICPYYHPL